MRPRHFVAPILAACVLASPARAQLLHYYPFTTNANDVVGGANGTLIGGAAVAGGQLVLNGTSAYVQFGTKIVPTSGSYTVALFARQTAAQPSYAELISQGFSSGPGFYIGHDPSHNIRVTDQWTVTGVPFPPVGSTAHLALTVDALTGRSRLYIDGALAATRNLAIATTTGGTNTRLGRQFDCCTEFFAGDIDELRVYGSALSRAEVAALATAVPEPSTVVLTATALLAVGGAARRRRHGA